MKRALVASLAALGSLAAIAPFAQAQGGTTSIPRGDIIIDLQLVCDGLTSPVYATGAGDQSDRLFIVDQVGEIRILELGLREDTDLR